MERKTALLAAVDLGRKLGDDLAGRLSNEEHAARGSYERWAPKDVFAHATEWLSRDLERLEITGGPMPFIGAEELEPANQAIFAEHAKKTWDDVARFFADTFDAARRWVVETSPEELERGRESADRSTRTAWKMIAGHALMHLSPHFGVVYDRRNEPEMATELQESTARALLDLDDTPEWVGTITYNLACHHALTGNAKRAIALLREALTKNPGITDWSKQDSDFDGIRDDPDFESVYDGT